MTHTREAVPPTPRRAMTRARRARILAAHDGRCAVAGCDRTDGLEIDHIVPLELSGADDDNNVEPLCRRHHLAKTRADVKAIAKARRIRRAADPSTRKVKRQIPARPFTTAFRRKFDGTVERVS